MKRSTLVCLLAALVAVGGGVAWTHREDFATRGLVDAQRKKLESARRQLADWRARSADTRRDLASARDDLAAARAAAESTATQRDQDPEVNAWAERVGQLKRLFAEHPEQRIPEMGLISDLDWIQLAREAKLGDDESIRSAMARVRDDAKSIFASKLAQALRRFTAAHDATLPSDLPQLLPFFDRPIDPAMLQRYNLVVTGKVADAVRGHPATPNAILERAPVDEDYDSRVHVDALGGMGSVRPWAANEVGDAVRTGSERFAATHNGAKPESATDILPFIESDRARALMTALAAYQQEHGGAEPTSAAELLPYAKDPLARTQLERMIRARQAQGGK
jgi:hypothetical protein